ncbi:glycosyltransferase [Aquifex aeolicus]|uniref:Glycosyltransferase family 1 protein n=1 Tax=Aquifex aeolicus (strain VF5) TaxID=224324 RepID=O66840_AQUAE|nr:glycosyltransferase [Aquifex aeolicus]AAC06809.1 hypothetical protein aq_572 [Aquifex aeolicus VF5]
MKIALFTDSFRKDLGGGTQVARQLAFGLSKKGYEVLVITGSTAEEETPFKVLKLPSIKYPFYHNVEIALPNVELLKELKNFNPDVIHYHDPFLAGTMALLMGKILKIPTVGTIHIHPKQLTYHGIKIDNGVIAKKLVSFFGNFTDCVVFVSKYQKKLYEELDSFCVKVIYNGIPDYFFVSEKRKLRNPRNRILTVSRLDKDKNPEFALKCVAEISKEVPVEYTIVGEGNEKEKLEKLARKLGIKANFLGFVPREELPELYLSHDVLLNTSKTETFGLSFAEAMATGMPVIALKEGSAPEIVGDGGILCEEKVECVKKAFLKLYQNPELYFKLSQKAPERAHVFRCERFLKDYESLYEEVIRTSVPR